MTLFVVINLALSLIVMLILISHFEKSPDDSTDRVVCYNSNLNYYIDDDDDMGSNTTTPSPNNLDSAYTPNISFETNRSLNPNATTFTPMCHDFIRDDPGGSRGIVFESTEGGEFSSLTFAGEGDGDDGGDHIHPTENGEREGIDNCDNSPNASI